MLDPDPAAGRSEQIARRFAAALEAGDVDAALATTSPVVGFHNPVVHKRYEGRDALGFILRSVVQTFEDFRYTAAYGADDDHVMAFAARMGDRALQKVDILHFDADGPALLRGHRTERTDGQPADTGMTCGHHL